MYKKEQTKKCPRCGNILNINAEKCTDCNLKFAKIQNLSNKQAKIEIKHKMKNRVLYLSKKPADVNFKRFLWLYFLLGWFGAHNIYVGKYKKGYYSLISFCLFTFTFIIEETLIALGIDMSIISVLDYYIVSTFAILSVFAILIWSFDGVNLLRKKYKYPSAVPQIDFEQLNTKKNSKDIIKEKE